jgi:hypothetical protein
MLKRLLTAVAILFVCPTSAFSQDFFISFNENSRVASAGFPSGASGATGSFFIFADENLDFNQLDLDFNHDNSSVVAFTGGVVYNDGAPASGTAAQTFGGSFTSVALLDPAGVANGITATDGRLFAVSLLSAGQVPGSGASNFRAGANGFLLARVDFQIVGNGSVDFSFVLGDLGIFNDGQGQLEGLTFASATLENDAVPICIGLPIMVGDVDLDGFVTSSDIPPFVSILISGGYQEEADCDFNGVVDFADIPAFIAILNVQ